MYKVEWSCIMSLNNIGISYSGSYLLQGNQIERLKKSLELKANTTELLLRTDKKECDIDSLRKVYNGNILFHVPAINPDLANLKIVNEIVRNLKENKIELITGHRHARRGDVRRARSSLYGRKHHAAVRHFVWCL